MKKFRTKVVAIVTAVLMVIVSFCIPSSKVSAENWNSRLSYMVFDLQNGDTHDRDYFLNSLDTLNSTATRTIIGTDTRSVDFSMSGVVKLVSESGFIGTGFVVDDHTIATAAHCVYNGSLTSSGCAVSQILLFDYNGMLSKTVTKLREVHVPFMYYYTINQYNTDASPYDYALITVEEDLSDYACFNLGYATDAFLNQGTALYVGGFPSKIKTGTNQYTVVNTHTKHSMYTGTGVMKEMIDSVIRYDVDASSGDSGAPVYIKSEFQGKWYYTVIGIHTFSGRYSCGTRVTSNQLQFYKNNPNI